MIRLQELLLRWQDGVLTPEESDELARMLDSEDARALLVEDFFTVQTLREGMANAVSVRPRSRRRLPLAVAAAALILAGAVGALFFIGSPGVPVARVTEVHGTVMGDDGKAIATASDVVAGHGLRTVGPASSAILQFPDGTRVDLGGDTALDHIDDRAGKRISVARGSASAVVRPQPAGEPMVFSTPHGRATVLGTTLRLYVDADAKGGTRLEVKEGKVQLGNLAGKTVLVESGHFAVASAGLQLTSRRAAPVKALELVGRMAPDSWLALPDTNLRRVAPDPQQYPKIQLISGVWSVIGAWSGGVYDTSRDRLIVWGGGASNYAGNEIYAFDLHELAWLRVTEPTADPALGRQVNNDGTPAGRGTGNGLAYIAHSDRMFATGGVIAQNAGSVGANILWTFDFQKSRWIDMKPSGPRPQTQAQNSCAYDPGTRKVWWLDGEGLYSYDVDSNLWTRHTTEGRFDRTFAVDTKRRRLVIVGQGEVLVVDLSAALPQPQVWKTSGGEAFITGRVGLDYDPVADRIVGWAGGPVYALDPGTGAWTAHNAPGAPKPTETGTYGRWRYAPSVGAFVVATDVDENVHFFKLGK